MKGTVQGFQDGEGSIRGVDSRVYLVREHDVQEPHLMGYRVTVEFEPGRDNYGRRRARHVVVLRAPWSSVPLRVDV